ncbi:prominin-like protein isoform X3 [Ceratina calcarata]|uniref:Prominin-like protein isoform X3 n=1 Tax=Ceratina calcarata TaxID=156304 RepID=A0AAJ7JA31_9HYME|nr:prominin-like protein isoform X3 [Ceratina calcarata]
MVAVLPRVSRPNAVTLCHNGFAVLWLLAVLLVSRVNCEESLSNRMRGISQDLDRQLNVIMASQALNYTTVNTYGLPYNATTKFDPKGMGQLYNVTNMFIDFVQNKQAYPEGMFTVVDRVPKFQYSLAQWKIVVTHYGGLAGLAFVGVLLAAILPCVGLFFCCCRCAGHCGARSQPFDKKHDHCRKVILSMVLIAVATIILFGVVCAFVTNEYMQDGTKDLPNNVKASLNDVKLYLNTTKSEILALLQTNFDELEINLNNILQASGRSVTEQLAVYSHAVSLTNLSDIVTGLKSVQEDLKTMHTITRELRTNASILEINIRKIKLNLMIVLNDCSAHNQRCKQVQNEYVNQMMMQVEFDKLPNVTSALDNISNLMKDNIVSEVGKGKEEFQKIQDDIQHAVNQTIPVVSASIRNVGHFLIQQAQSMMMLVDRINGDIDKLIKHLNVAQTHIDQYSPYRYYLGLGISAILLIVLMCLTFGLFCGICGKRPDGYGDDCCNKGSGARFLMMAVWIIFLLTSVLMVITVVHMVTGVLVQRAICEPLKNPQDNRMFALVDEVVQVKQLLYPNNSKADINMSYIVTECHWNRTLYEVLKLKYLFDVTSLHDYRGRYDINDTIQQLQRKISLSPGVIILTDTAKKKLNELAESGLSDIKFYQYIDVLKDNITNINLEHLAKQLRDIATELPTGDIQDRLNESSMNLESYHRDLIRPMTMLSEQLVTKAEALEEKIKFNHTSMAEAIHHLVEEVTKAQDILNTDGPEYVKELATNFGNAFLLQVDGYLERVTDSALHTVGRCGPVSNAYNATLVAGCNRILDPFNGFWASVGWCLVLFIPTIILCVKLSALYQKSDPYPGPLVEAEYLYDAYADRDNIPLTHVHDKKYVSHSRDPYAKYESYDGPAGGYSERERVPEAHQSTSHYHHYSRYSDVAPNSTPTWRSHEITAPSKTEPQSKVFSISVDTQNCDFPNGGPPGYHPAAAAPPPLSTEYERPPPYYYYPGPGYKRTLRKKGRSGCKRDYV